MRKTVYDHIVSSFVYFRIGQRWGLRTRNVKTANTMTRTLWRELLGNVRCSAGDERAHSISMANAKTKTWYGKG